MLRKEACAVLLSDDRILIGEAPKAGLEIFEIYDIKSQKLDSISGLDPVDNRVLVCLGGD